MDVNLSGAIQQVQQRDAVVKGLLLETARHAWGPMVAGYLIECASKEQAPDPKVLNGMAVSARAAAVEFCKVFGLK